MSTIPLASVLIEGTTGNRPTAGSAGRLFFATDTATTYYDNGTGWDNVTPMPAAFTGDTGAGGTPGVVPSPPAGSAAAGKFLKADGTWEVPPSGLNVATVALTPSAAGNFTVVHGLGTTPRAVVFVMTSGGQIWFQGPSTTFDSTSLYLTASDASVTGSAVCFY